ncbi:CBS domain-containing protein [Nesterenkonia alkaliphila]|uniref:CBS domain-containing protein n=1 Tax=Nesterenkonia alkaliphila TaxID=1463631 RepID=A0A7K1UEZ6_9MICC|nr:CBS domain-containing protein [Nesterenkonia alkaliphila]MVT25038.1 hypothetical protein [Nesterenkonia alkaliphila]GFZ99862.1 hypothetical protein GCM10011359_30850 [Nesterenkonia alkaliphila]
MTRDDALPTKLRELIHPVGHRISHTHGLESAARMLSETGADYIVITNMSDRAVGVVTDRDLDNLKESDPERWSFRRCASAVKTQPRLTVDDTVEDVLKVFDQQEVRPLLVHEGREVAGILRPTEVFQWCAEHRPSALDHLARHVAQ